jgi:hypothetical protein
MTLHHTPLTTQETNAAHSQHDPRKGFAHRTNVSYLPSPTPLLRPPSPPLLLKFPFSTTTPRALFVPPLTHHVRFTLALLPDRLHRLPLPNYHPLRFQPAPTPHHTGDKRRTLSTTQAKARTPNQRELPPRTSNQLATDVPPSPPARFARCRRPASHAFWHPISRVSGPPTTSHRRHLGPFPCSVVSRKACVA